MSADKVLDALTAAGVPCARIAEYDEVFTDPGLHERGFYWDAPHSALGPVRQLGSPMRFSRTPTRRDHPGQSLGESTGDVLAEFDSDRVAR